MSAEPEATQQITQGTPVIADKVVTIPLRFHRKKDGTVFPVEITGRFFTRQGRPVHIAAIRDITARRRVEAQIRHLSSFPELDPAPVMEIDAEGRALYANPAARRQFAAQLAQLAPDLEAMHRTSGGMETHRFRELEIGAQIWGITLHYVPEFKTVRVYASDITERKRAENALRAAQARLEQQVAERTAHLLQANMLLEKEIAERKQAEEAQATAMSLLQATIESTADGILVVNMAGKIVGHNRRFAQLWRLPQEILNSSDDSRALDFVLSQLKEPEAFLAKVRQLYDAPEAESFDLLDFKDGRVFERYSQPQHLDGRPVGRVWSFRDITAQKQAEQALRDSELRFRTVADFTYDWEYWIRENGALEYVSPACEIISGYRPEDFLADPKLMETIVHPDDRAVFHAHLEAVSEPTPKTELEFRIISRNGEERWIGHVCQPVFDTQGKYAGRRASNRDITQRKRAEADVRRHQEQLVQAAKMVALGTLVSGVAHEINNPNQFIMLNTPVLENLVKKAQPLLDREYEQNGDFLVGQMQYTELKGMIPNLLFGIKKGSLRIKQIVEELRNFARQTGPELRAGIDVTKVVESAIALMENMIRKATANFKFTPPGPLPLVSGNFQRLEQVIINLLQNACQALSDNTKGIEVSLAHDCEAQCIVLRVRDEGAGMTAETLQRLKEPFFTTRRESGGTGLGLSISDRIIREHGGTLRFTSEVGKGTVAVIELPVAERTR